MTEKIELYPVDQIEEVSWNMNRMLPEQFEALKADMKKNGPDGIDPILVVRKKILLNDPSVSEDLRFVINGNHRLRAAKELGWKQIRVVFDNELIDPAIVRLVSYQKNTERGDVDEFKVAENFKWLVDNGWKQDRIAAAYGIARETVGKRLSLLQVQPEIKEEMEKIPGIGASHYEPIATLPPTLQKKAIDEIKSASYDVTGVTVRDVEQIGKRVRKQERDRQEFEKTIKEAKFPDCPTCKEKATYASGRELPWFHCKNYHVWNSDTGKKEYDYGTAPPRKKKEPEKPKIPDHVDLTISFEEARKILGTYALKQLGRFREFTELDVSGRTSYAHSELSFYDLSDNELEFTLREARTNIELVVKPADYKDPERKMFKTIVTTPGYHIPKTVYEFKKLEDAAKEVLHVQLPKRKRGRPKKANKK